MAQLEIVVIIEGIESTTSDTTQVSLNLLVKEGECKQGMIIREHRPVIHMPLKTLCLATMIFKTAYLALAMVHAKLIFPSFMTLFNCKPQSCTVLHPHSSWCSNGMGQFPLVWWKFVDGFHQRTVNAVEFQMQLYPTMHCIQTSRR